MMDLITELLFENLTLLLLVSALAMAVALAMHRRRYTEHSRRAVYITLGVCGCLIVLQNLVVTQRELLNQRIEVLSAACDAGDMAAMGTCFAEEVRFGSPVRGITVPRQAIVVMASLALQEYEVNEARVGNVHIEMQDDRAFVRFSVTCDLKGPQAAYRVPSIWKLRCTYADDDWRVDQITEGKFGLEGFGQGQDIMRYLRGRLDAAVRGLENTSLN